MINEEKDLISVIVPVYKVEEDIRECIASLLAQTYDNVEILLIDDGSPDNCGKICDEYAEKNKKIKVIHRTNQGLSATRNYGVSIARGDYIYFLDSDDCISADCFEYLMSLIKEYNADISVSRMAKFTNQIPADTNAEHKETVFSAEEALIEMCYGQKFAMSACNKLYKKELVQRYPFPVGKIYEEVATTYKIVGDAKAIVYGNAYTYYYRMRESSIVHQKLSADQLYGITASEEMLSYVSNRYPNAVQAAKHRCFAKICDCIEKTFDSKKDFQPLRQKAKQYYKCVMSDKRALKGIKFKCFAIRLGFLPAKIAFGIHKKVKKKKRQ